MVCALKFKGLILVLNSALSYKLKKDFHKMFLSKSSCDELDVHIYSHLIKGIINEMAKSSP